MSIQNRKSGSEAGLDEIDSRLLTALSENVRLSNAELARQVGLSAPSVAERVRRLEDRGLITGYGARVDPSKLGLALTIMIRARPLPGEMKNISKRSAARPKSSDVTGFRATTASLRSRMSGTCSRWKP